MPEYPVSSHTSALCIDIDGHSQRVLLYQRGVAGRDMPRCVLPSPAQTLAQRIRQYSAEGRDVFLCGPPMGKELRPALDAHIRDGLRVALARETALALYGGEHAAADAGAQVTKSCPDGYARLHTGDIDMVFWRDATRLFGMDIPPLVAVAAEDHGPRVPEDVCETGGGSCYEPGDDDAKTVETDAFWLWRHILRTAPEEGAAPEDFLLRDVPPEMARLHAIQQVTGGPVALAGAASLLGLLHEPDIVNRSFRQGVLLINAGAEHLTAFLVWRGRVLGIYEQHTRTLDAAHIARDLEEFRLGWLPHEEVRRHGGHGCLLLPLPPEAEGFAPAYITGREREILAGQGKMVRLMEDAAFTGSYGLLRGLGLGW